MEVTAEPHAAVAISAENSSHYSRSMRLGGRQCRSGHVGKVFIQTDGIWSLVPPYCSLVTILTMLSCLL